MVTISLHLHILPPYRAKVPAIIVPHEPGVPHYIAAIPN